uniref:Vitelline membrane outer layer 1 homolog n=1 Tax=Cynoglossus semilaevis TaxID=244447 RepID=A0A3P8UTZ1_CYNSE
MDSDTPSKLQLDWSCRSLRICAKFDVKVIKGHCDGIKYERSHLILSCHRLFVFKFFGEWSHPQFCPSGVLTSFQLRVERHRGLFGDDTAANNIKFRCSSNPTLEGPGMDWGEYGYWSEDCTDGGICGIETKMEEYQRGLDDSTLNDVRFHCCNKSQ